MKIIIIALCVVMLSGCNHSPISAPVTNSSATNSTKRPQQQPPCAPNPTDLINRHPAQIIDKTQEKDTNWSTLHEASCNDSEATVMPSLRMYMYAEKKFSSFGQQNQWLAEHTYCVPD